MRSHIKLVDVISSGIKADASIIRVAALRDWIADAKVGFDQPFDVKSRLEDPKMTPWELENIFSRFYYSNVTPLEVRAIPPSHFGLVFGTYVFEEIDLSKISYEDGEFILYRVTIPIAGQKIVYWYGARPVVTRTVSATDTLRPCVYAMLDNICSLWPAKDVKHVIMSKNDKLLAFILLYLQGAALCTRHEIQEMINTWRETHR